MPAATSNTVFGIIKDAMQDAGYIQEGEEPNSEQLSVNMRRLCDIINLWQTQGLKLFFLQDITVPLVVGQIKYSLKPTGGAVSMVKPMRVIDAYMQDPAGNKRPLHGLARNEWTMLTQTTTGSGAINSYFVDKQATSLDVSVWLKPDASEILNAFHLILQIQAPNPANLEENTSFPQEWRIALRWGLADDIATGQPQAIMDRCEMRAKVYREMLEDWDVEDVGTTFAPSMQRAYQRNFTR